MDRDDLFLAQECIRRNVSAQAELRSLLNHFVKAVLWHRGASQTEADDIVGDLSSDCLAHGRGNVSLLRKYHGRCSLKNWLSKVATNRWIDLKRREAISAGLTVGDGNVLTNPVAEISSQDVQADDDFLQEILRASLDAGFSACTAEDQVMLRLVYLEGLTQREVGLMWGWHESKVSRRLKEILRLIELKALAKIKATDPWLTVSWNDYLNLSQLSAMPLF